MIDVRNMQFAVFRASIIIKHYFYMFSVVYEVLSCNRLCMATPMQQNAWQIFQSQFIDCRNKICCEPLLPWPQVSSEDQGPMAKRGLQKYTKAMRIMVNRTLWSMQIGPRFATRSSLILLFLFLI